MERKKFTTSLDKKTLLALDIIRFAEDLNNKNAVIEFLVRNYITNNNLEATLNVKIKKDE